MRGRWEKSLPGACKADRQGAGQISNRFAGKWQQGFHGAESISTGVGLIDKLCNKVSSSELTPELRLAMQRGGFQAI